MSNMSPAKNSSDFQDKSLQELIRIIDEGLAPKVKLQAIKTIFSKVVSLAKIQDEVLKHVMFQLQNLFEVTFETLLTFRGCELEIPITCLNLLTDSLSTLSNILDCLANKQIDYAEVESVPILLPQILLDTFQRCKDCDLIYKARPEVLSEIMVVFKQAQIVQHKFLKGLESSTQFECTEKEVTILQNVLEVLGKIGQVLSYMDIKSMADVWKSYVNLIVKYSCHLKSDFKVPLDFFVKEVVNSLSAALTMDNSVVFQKLKISNFFVKIMVKLWQLLQSNLIRYLTVFIDFFIAVNGYNLAYLKHKKCPNEIIGHCSSLILEPCDLFLDDILQTDFFEIFCEHTKAHTNHYGLLYLCSEIFRKNEQFDFINFEKFLELIFNLIGECYVELLCNLQPSLYEDLVVYSATIILTLNNYKFNEIEILLFKNVLTDHIWKALFAVDIWCLVMSQAGQELNFETLSNILNKTEGSISKRPPGIFLNELIKRFYRALPKQLKMELLEQYPHAKKIVGLAEFTKVNSIMSPLVGKVIEHIDNLKNEKLSIQNYKELCINLEILSTVNCRDLMNSYGLFTKIVALWECNELASDESVLFQWLFEMLCRVTANFSSKFNNQELALILNRFQNKNTDHAKLLKLNFFQLYLGRINSQPDKGLSHAISTQLANLLQDNNPIIKEETLALYSLMLNRIVCQEILHNSTNNPKIFELVSNYMAKDKYKNLPIPVDEYFKLQQRYEFKHTCIKQPERTFDQIEREPKKLKTNDYQINLIISRIQNDVKCLTELYTKENLTIENGKALSDVLTELKKLL